MVIGSKFRRNPAKGNPFRPADHVGLAVPTVGAKVSTTINVAYKLEDVNGRPLPSIGHVFIYLSDDAAGLVIAASAPSGGWVIGTNGLLIPLVTNKAAHFISNAAGLLDISITEASTKIFYANLVHPTGKILTTPVNSC